MEMRFMAWMAALFTFLQGNEETIYPPGEGNGFELFGHNAFTSKIGKLPGYRSLWDFMWGLYDLNTDPAELNDLSTVILRNCKNETVV